MVRPSPSEPNHFTLFGLTPALDLDLSKLRDSFYELSRQVHPDRFALAGPDEQASALARSTLLNRAYQVLRDPDARARYLLELYGSPETGAGVPAELAEAYFEAEDLRAFREDLLARLAAEDTERRKLAAQWSEAGIPALRELVDRKRYLQSMLRDLEAKLS